MAETKTIEKVFIDLKEGRQPEGRIATSNSHGFGVYTNTTNEFVKKLIKHLSIWRGSTNHYEKTGYHYYEMDCRQFDILETLLPRLIKQEDYKIEVVVVYDGKHMHECFVNDIRKGEIF